MNKSEYCENGRKSSDYIQGLVLARGMEVQVLFRAIRRTASFIRTVDFTLITPPSPPLADTTADTRKRLPSFQGRVSVAKRAKKRFYLIKRRNRRSEAKAIYYCRIRGSDGNLLPWKSTGQTTKSAAENWALDHLHEIASVRKTLTFKEYAEG